MFKSAFVSKEGILDRRVFLVCFRGLIAVKAAQAARSLWTRPLFRLRAI